jgi:thiamine-phosphate pyrophosphorylase
MASPADPPPSPLLSERRERLARARLYLVAPARPGGREPGPFLRAALRGGVDLVQLREKDAPDEDVLRAAEAFRSACAEIGVPFVLNDRPDLVAAAGADGVHVGQDDGTIARARALAGPDAVVGRSTHTPAQVAAAAEADYIACGPVHPTPTKPGRPATGLGLVTHAARVTRVPAFAIGGIDARNVGEVLAAGARRIVVVRAITEAPDPEAAARGLRAALDAAAGHREMRVGSA